MTIQKLEFESGFCGTIQKPDNLELKSPLCGSWLEYKIHQPDPFLPLNTKLVQYYNLHCIWFKLKFLIIIKFACTVGIWNLTIQNPKIFRSGLFEGWISNDRVFKWSGFSYDYSDSPNHLKTRAFQIGMFLSRYQMVFDNMVAICPDFKWSGFHILDPIGNPDYL